VGVDSPVMGAVPRRRARRKGCPGPGGRAAGSPPRTAVTGPRMRRGDSLPCERGSEGVRSEGVKEWGSEGVKKE
jgi:hypothetical protein